MYCSMSMKVQALLARLQTATTVLSFDYSWADYCVEEVGIGYLEYNSEAGRCNSLFDGCFGYSKCTIVEVCEQVARTG